MSKKIEKGIIYKITNKINGKQYIGQTTTTLNKRMSSHKSGKKSAIDKAINKYGIDNFEVEIIEKCPLDNLNDREIYWIDYFDTYNSWDYNCHIGGNNMSGKNHTMWGKKRPEFAKKISEILSGKEKTEEHKRKLSEARKGKNYGMVGENHPMYGKKHTEESLEKMRKSQKGKKNGMYGKERSYEEKIKMTKNSIKNKDSPFCKIKGNVNEQLKQCLDIAIDIIYDIKINGLTTKQTSNKYGVGISMINSIINLNHWIIKYGIEKEGKPINLLQEDIKESARELGYYHRRLRDVIGKFGSSSPFDELVITDHYALGLECKMINDKAQSKSFPFSRLSDDQRKGLLEFREKEICKSFVITNFRWTNNRKGECYALTIDEFIELEKTIGRKSIPLDYFRENVLQLPRLGKGWDLSKLFEEVKLIE